MLQIHEAVAVICHAYPEGKNWVCDKFYYGLEFMPVELLEREQVGASFDTLYMLAKKMEACQSTHTH